MLAPLSWLFVSVSVDCANLLSPRPHSQPRAARRRASSQHLFIEEPTEPEGLLIARTVQQKPTGNQSEPCDPSRDTEKKDVGSTSKEEGREHLDSDQLQDAPSEESYPSIERAATRGNGSNTSIDLHPAPQERGANNRSVQLQDVVGNHHKPKAKHDELITVLIVSAIAAVMIGAGFGVHYLVHRNNKERRVYTKDNRGLITRGYSEDIDSLDGYNPTKGHVLGSTIASDFV